MIQTSTDYHAAIDFLTQEATVNINDINEKMSSLDINTAFGSIEMQLIDLYEKTRVLEDVQNYCREYVIKELTNKRQKIESKLKIIEHNVDSYQDTTYVACEVPFTKSNEVVRDRDGLVIPLSDIVSGTIVQSGQKIEETLFKSADKKQTFPHYRDNLDDLVTGKPYRVFYTLDTPVNGGIKEEITINFDGLYKCNFLNIKTSNCDVIDIKYINESDVEESAGDIRNACSVSKIAKGLKISINCINYKIETFKIDMSKNQRDFWSIIQDERFRRNGSMTSLYDITRLVGVMQNKVDQNEFHRQAKAWQQVKTEIDKRNIAMAQKFGGDSA